MAHKELLPFFILFLDSLSVFLIVHRSETDVKTFEGCQTKEWVPIPGESELRQIFECIILGSL